MTDKSVDVLLVGAGAMSTTLGTLLKQLDPSLSVLIVERLNSVAQESTDGWNNAGTGHAAYCELNYTAEMEDGQVNIEKATAINAAFEVSLQFWSYLVEQKLLPEPHNFINPVPHQSLVWGEKNVTFLRNRYETLKNHHLFAEMEYTEDPEVITQWMPLIMKDRQDIPPCAATRIAHGTDVNFGALARYMAQYLQEQEQSEIRFNSHVNRLEQQADKSWNVSVQSQGKTEVINAKFVFLGAGGGALPLLQKSGIPESHGYAGFPVSGQWLICEKPEVVEQHYAKVYGAAPIGAPPMSVPHLDTRIIDGKKALLFGPFAGFTTKFLKKGSIFDMPFSVRSDNIKPMLSVAKNNMDLTRYLISEVLQSKRSRVDSLREFYPQARDEDWRIGYAGQRVQIIKKDGKLGGKLEFGTEAIVSADGSLAALLGASPGASTTVNTIVNILERSFPEQVKTPEWQDKIKTMIPSYGESLIDDADLLRKVRSRTLQTLELDYESYARQQG
ncbi:malate dehydrogenase (quinone) [Marinomonas agarivorans]|nr:malate dehydrogenase (quinone) [Marinomonas agarivorans]